MTNFTWEDEDELDGAWDAIEAAAPPLLPSDQEEKAEAEKTGRSRRLFWITATAVVIAFGTVAWILQARVQRINA